MSESKIKTNIQKIYKYCHIAPKGFKFDIQKIRKKFKREFIVLKFQALQNDQVIRYESMINYLSFDNSVKFLTYLEEFLIKK